MINTLAQIDYLASAGHSPWHRASALTKLSLVALLVGLAVFAPGAPVLLVLLASALALTLTARIPAGLIGAAAVTPLLFALIVALARLPASPDEALRLVLRPVTAGLAALWLVGTTPYPDLFAPLSRVLPRSVGDGLFLTYRAVFALLSRVERLWKALFLRGALHGPVSRRAGLMGEAVGTVVLSGFERSQRLYQVMMLRGHSGRICGCRHWLEVGPDDAYVAGALGWIALASAVLWSARLP